MIRLAHWGYVLLLLGSSATLIAQADEARRVEFGANGHPLNTGTYATMPLEEQVSLLKKLGLKTYRVNVNPAYPDNFDRLSQLVSIAEREHIRILPVVVIPAQNYSDEGEAYNYAKSAVSPLIKQFEGRIHAWELGNEYDLYSVKKGADGASPDDYDAEKYAIVRGLIRGMIQALREANSSARSMVETSQHTSTTLDSGFLQRLIDDGIRFDITAYHYYSGNGRIPHASTGQLSLEVLHEQFHRPIWITEFDKAASSRTVGPNADSKAQAIALSAALEEISADAEQYCVIGADIYELLDEPNLLRNPNIPPSQAQFGIMTSDGRPTAASEAVQRFLSNYH